MPVRMIATLRWNTMRVDGARFSEGQRFVVRREFIANGENGPMRCYSLGRETGDYLIPCIDAADVDVELESVRRDRIGRNAESTREP